MNRHQYPKYAPAAGLPDQSMPNRGVAGPAMLGRAERWVLGTSMTCCIVMVAAILIALVAVTPAPLVTAAGLLALLVVAVFAARIVVRALQRETSAKRVEGIRTQR